MNPRSSSSLGRAMLADMKSLFTYAKDTVVDAVKNPKEALLSLLCGTFGRLAILTIGSATVGIGPTFEALLAFWVTETALEYLGRGRRDVASLPVSANRSVD